MLAAWIRPSPSILIVAAPVEHLVADVQLGDGTISTETNLGLAKYHTYIC